MARAMGLEASAPATAKQAITGADLIVTSVTLSYEIEPFLDARWLKPGAFATVTDLGLPWKPEGMQVISPLYIDDQAQEDASPKKLVDPALVTGDLKALLTDGPGRFCPDARRAFLFRGLGIGDFAIARLGYLMAVDQGAGQSVGW